MESRRSTGDEEKPKSSKEDDVAKKCTEDSKNSLKRARQFDFEMLLAETIQQKHCEAAEAAATDLSAVVLHNEKAHGFEKCEEKRTTGKTESSKSGSSSSTNGRDYQV
jgi:hypothetical protein